MGYFEITDTGIIVHTDFSREIEVSTIENDNTFLSIVCTNDYHRKVSAILNIEEVEKLMMALMKALTLMEE